MSTQKELTEQYILPYVDEILLSIAMLRQKIDAELKRDLAILKHLKQWKKEYPIGLCAEIRNMMMDFIMLELKNPTSEGLQRLKEFTLQGGLILPFWGIDKNLYFENAILLGDAVLDVANDTVDTHKRPIEFYPSLATSPLQPVNNFTEVAEITEKYWGHDVYPNVYLPELAPAYPLVAIVQAYREDGDSVSGLVLLGDFADFYEKNLHTVKNGHLFGLAHDVIFNSTYSAKRLPVQMVSDLQTERFKDSVFDYDTQLQKVAGAFQLYRTDVPGAVMMHVHNKANEIKKEGERVKSMLLAKMPKRAL